MALVLSGSLKSVRADVGGVYSSQPTFGKGQPLTITVSAEDDDGNLRIESSLGNSELTVSNCQGVGPDQDAGECDGSGLDAVEDNGTDEIVIDTDAIDDDDESELLEVTLTLIANCNKAVVVTISADQPGNHGPDDVTVNCIPPTPTPSPTPTATATPLPTFPPFPTFPPAPTSTPPVLISTVLGSITPPSTGDGGLRR
jgi:hypothetical protein